MYDSHMTLYMPCMLQMLDVDELEVMATVIKVTAPVMVPVMAPVMGPVMTT